MPVIRTTGMGSLIMSNGLIISPNVMAAQVTSLDLHFEPSAAIIARKLNTLGHNLKDFRTPLRRAINQVIIPSIQINFHKGGRPRWPRLEEDTVRHKGGNMKPLIRSSALQSGMKSSKIWTITRNTAFLADLPGAIWYGKVHQAGYGGHQVETEYGIAPGGSRESVVIGTFNVGAAGSIPPRPFVMIQPQDEEMIELVFDLWLEEQIIKAGLK